MFGDLGWPLNASRGFVIIRWASCMLLHPLRVLCLFLCVSVCLSACLSVCLYACQQENSNSGVCVNKIIRTKKTWKTGLKKLFKGWQPNRHTAYFSFLFSFFCCIAFALFSFQYSLALYLYLLYCTVGCLCLPELRINFIIMPRPHKVNALCFDGLQYALMHYASSVCRSVCPVPDHMSRTERHSKLKLTRR